MIRDDVCPLEPEPGAPRVAIFSAYNDAYAELAAIARPNWKAYCERHGYLLRFYPQGYHTDPTRPETYGDKGRFECYYDLRGHVDIVMYLDIDALFMNPSIAVEVISSWQTEEQRAFATFRWLRPFFWTYDDNGPLSGLWIARTDDTTEKHLRFAYSFAARESNVRHGKIEPNGISDQDAMTRLMHVPPFRDTFGNCYPAADVGHCYPENFVTGKWIVTFPGRTVKQKRTWMEHYVKSTR